MFSSAVSMAESRRPVLLITASPPMSTERICVTLTVSWRSIGYGRIQLIPAPTVDWYLPKRVTTDCWPSCTMKNPLSSQMTRAAPAIMPMPMPAPLPPEGWPPESGFQRGSPPPLPPPWPPRPPNRLPSLRLRSCQSSSRSGGPCSGRLPGRGCCSLSSSCWLRGSCVAAGRSPASSSLRPQRGSFRLNMRWNAGGRASARRRSPVAPGLARPEEE